MRYTHVHSTTVIHSSMHGSLQSVSSTEHVCSTPAPCSHRLHPSSLLYTGTLFSQAPPQLFVVHWHLVLTGVHPSSLLYTTALQIAVEEASNVTHGYAQQVQSSVGSLSDVRMLSHLLPSSTLHWMQHRS